MFTYWYRYNSFYIDRYIYIYIYIDFEIQIIAHGLEIFDVRGWGVSNVALKSNLLKINITGLIDTTATIITIGKLLLKIQQVDGVCFVGCLTKKTLYCRIFPHFHLVSSICITAIL